MPHMVCIVSRDVTPFPNPADRSMTMQGLPRGGGRHHKRCASAGYGMLVGWLDRNGQFDTLAHPCDPVTQDLIRAFITEYSVGRAETTVASAIRGVAYVLRAACRPTDQLRLDVAYTDPSYVPVQEVLNDYVLINLSAEYRLSSNFSLTGRIENLLDQDYEEVFSFATPGISAYGGIRARF